MPSGLQQRQLLGQRDGQRQVEKASHYLTVGLRVLDVELVVHGEVPALRRAVAVVAELGQHIVRFPRQAVQALIRRSSRLHMGQVGARERIAGAAHVDQARARRARAAGAVELELRRAASRPGRRPPGSGNHNSTLVRVHATVEILRILALHATESDQTLDQAYVTREKRGQPLAIGCSQDTLFSL